MSVMQDNLRQEAILLLEDGTIFRGFAAGKIGTTTGEICFNTGMTGYQEIFTDPSYFGQILVATNAHIGNYGTKDTDTESKDIKISGFICKNFTNEYSRSLADQSIQEYFEKEGLVAISDVDTRAIVRHIRDKGAMNAIISSDDLDIDSLKAKLKKVPSMEGLELASKVSTKEPYDYGDPAAEFKVAVYDFGVKESILKCLADRGCYLRVFPARTDYQEIEAWEPDGYFFSNGPGDPAAMDYGIANAKAILKLSKPVFGICLGHQVLALAHDIPTHKMHHGHRGINHPVKNLQTGLCEITSQNHGFAVTSKEIPEDHANIEVTHVNLNDQSVEGIRQKDGMAFSVQYHPEASPGPHDARYLFDQFIKLISTYKTENILQ